MTYTSRNQWRWKIPYRSREWRELFHLPGLERALVEKGHSIANIAEAIAPVDTGEYRDSFRVTVDRRGKRPTIRLENTSDHALAVEFGWDRTPEYHTLQKAALSAAERVGTDV